MIGVDLVDMSKVEKIYRKHGADFIRKILTHAESAPLPVMSDSKRLATIGRYMAAKEAIYKTCDLPDLDWTEIEIKNIETIPTVQILHPAFKGEVIVSVSQQGRTACAFAWRRATSL